jgi:hypothetical protein
VYDIDGIFYDFIQCIYLIEFFSIILISINIFKQVWNGHEWSAMAVAGTFKIQLYTGYLNTVSSYVSVIAFAGPAIDFVVPFYFPFPSLNFHSVLFCSPLLRFHAIY